MTFGTRTQATPYRIRSAETADADAILDVHRRSILEIGPAAYSATECESWAAGLVAEGYVDAMTVGGEVYLVAEDVTGVCGFCSFRHDEVIGLYVHPRAVRMGVGSMLLGHAERLIGETDVEKIRISAALCALPFYQARGYHIVQRKMWTTRGGVEIAVCDMEKHQGKPA